MENSVRKENVEQNLSCFSSANLRNHANEQAKKCDNEKKFIINSES
jgi:tRNA G37 N-methylase TrmD